MSTELTLLASQIPKPDTPTHLKKYCAKIVKHRQNPDGESDPLDDAGAISAMAAMTTAFSVAGDASSALGHHWSSFILFLPMTIIFPIISAYFLRDTLRYESAQQHLIDIPSEVIDDFLPPLNNILTSLSTLEPDNQTVIDELNAILHQAAELYQQKEQTCAELLPLTPATLISRARRSEYMAKKHAFAAATINYRDLLDSVTQTSAQSAIALLGYQTVTDSASTSMDLTALQERLNTHTDVYTQLHTSLPSNSL